MRHLCSILAMAALLTATSSAQALVLLNDDFNGENGGNGVINYAAFANWDVNDGSVDLLGPGLVDFLPTNGIYVDLDGTSNNASVLQTKTAFSFQAGDVITVQFDLAGPCEIALPDCSGFPNLNNGLNTVLVTMGALNESFTKGFNDPLETISRTFTASSAFSAALTFDHSGGDNIGLILDNVQISVQNLQNVSEPTPFVLTAGLVLVLTARRRQNSKHDELAKTRFS